MICHFLALCFKRKTRNGSYNCTKYHIILFISFIYKNYVFESFYVFNNIVKAYIVYYFFCLKKAQSIKKSDSKYLFVNVLL